MLDFLNSLNSLDSYASTISAFSAFVSMIMVIISTGFVIWTACFRKTRREKVDDLKFAILLLCYEEGRTEFTNDEIQEVLEKLEDKFQEEKYKKLHEFAVRELENEASIMRIGTYDAHLGKPENFQ